MTILLPKYGDVLQMKGRSQDNQRKKRNKNKLTDTSHCKQKDDFGAKCFLKWREMCGIGHFKIT